MLLGLLKLVTRLVTNAPLTAVENKTPDVSNLLTKTDYDIKISEIENKFTNHNDDKYNTTPEFIKLTAEKFAARLAQVNLTAKTDFDNRLISLNRKINSSKRKYVIFENKLRKPQTLESSYFRDKRHFELDVAQNYLIFQTMYRYFKKISGVANGEYLYFWKWNGI